jgi:hypothetical protein
MSKTKRIGSVLILVGLFIPSLLYPFAELTYMANLERILFASKGINRDVGLRDLEIAFSKGTFIAAERRIEGRIAIPYKYVVAFGVILAFTGAGFIFFKKGVNNAV